MKKIAVIGGGSWGKNLIRVFSQTKSLYAICDINEEVLREYKARYPDITVATNPEQILGDKEIEGVVIATPSMLHHKLAREALLNHKHTFVEKPLALSFREGAELVKLAKKTRRVLMVGHVLQYHNAVTKLKRLIDKNELGRIQYIYSNRLNIGKIRTEENILWSFAPHDISVILMLLGEFPESITTTGGSYLQHNVADVTLTTMNFSSGVKAQIFVSWLHPFKEQKLIVVGDKKMAVFDDLSKEKLCLYPHKIKWRNSLPIASKAHPEIVSFKMKEPLENECKHFLECIGKNKVPKTDGAESLKVLRILELSQESLDKHGKVIYLKDKHGKHHGDRYFVHESSYVDQDVEVGEGTEIWHFSHIVKGSRIGRNCKIGQNVAIGPDVRIGDRCKIQNNVSIYKGVTLEDEVFCGPSCVFTNVYNPRSAIPRMDELKTTLLKKGATIGANATIICGTTIGRYAFVGAGAVVKKDVPDHALVVGVPAKRIDWMCRCGVTLKFSKNHATCENCKDKYRLVNKILKLVKG